MPWLFHQVPTSRAGVGRRLGGSYTYRNERATQRVTVGRVRVAADVIALTVVAPCRKSNA
jgi:hypothetical protein